MLYDIYGPTWTTTTGPNSPLDGSCGTPADNTLSAKSGIAYWLSTGFSASHITLGLPAYGHSWVTQSSTLATTNHGSKPSQLYQPWSSAGKGPAGDDTWRYTDLIGKGVSEPLFGFGIVADATL